MSTPSIDIPQSSINPATISQEHPQGVIVMDVAALKQQNDFIAIDGVSSMIIALLLMYTIFVFDRPEVMKWWMYAIEAPLWVGLFALAVLRYFV